MKLHVIPKTKSAKRFRWIRPSKRSKPPSRNSLKDAPRVPIRTQLGIPLHDGVTLFMPAYLEQTDKLGMKMVSVFSGNIERGLPTINAMVTLVERRDRPSHGDSRRDLSHRGSARRGFGSRHRSSGTEGCDVGGRARDGSAGKDTASGLLRGAVHRSRFRVRPLRGLRSVLSRRDGELWSTRPANIEVMDSAAKALRDADVVCTATTSKTPFSRMAS